MARMSNRDRIARAAEEARLTAAEKEKSKTTKKAPKKKSTGTRTKRSTAPVRMKIVWEVWRSPGTTIKTFAYPDKDDAEAEVKSLTQSTGVTHSLRATKVPME